jgi:hypothetical protein
MKNNLKKRLYLALLLILLCLFVVSSVLVLLFWFKNPSLTQMEVFTHRWYFILPVYPITFASFFLLNKYKDM